MSAQGLKILIIGGGFSGMSAAIQLRKAGASVDLVEIDPGWRSYGAGISVLGPTLRAFRTLGILDEFLKRGAGTDGVDLFTSSGHPIGSLPTPRLAGPDVPGQGAIMRPVLAAILAEATKAAGTTVRLGATFSGLDERRRWRAGAAHRRLRGRLRPRDRRRRAWLQDEGHCVPECAGPSLHRPVCLAGRHASPARDRADPVLDGRQGEGWRQSCVARRDVHVRNRGSADERAARPKPVRRNAEGAARSVQRSGRKSDPRFAQRRFAHRLSAFGDAACCRGHGRLGAWSSSATRCMRRRPISRPAPALESKTPLFSRRRSIARPTSPSR